jgi:hypothetical protein
MESELVFNIACSSEAGGHSDCLLDPGSYRLVADEVHLDHDADGNFRVERPGLSVAALTRSTRSVPHDPEDGYFDEVIDAVLGKSLDPGGFTVAAAGEYRMAWSGKATYTLVKVA